MATIDGNFDFKKYDIGGGGATAGDGKLTGEEAQKARSDGWNVWDGYALTNGTPEKANQGTANFSEKLKQINNLQNLQNIVIPDEVRDKIKAENEGRPINIIEFPQGLIAKIDNYFNNHANVDTDSDENNNLTPEQKEARAELDKKQSSTGTTYAEAKAKVAEILQKYPDAYETETIKESDSEQQGDEVLYVLRYHEPSTKKVFNPNLIPEPARTEYKEAKASMAEIENANSTLATKGGIEITQIQPSTVQHSSFDNIDLSELYPDFRPKEPTEKQKEARTKLNNKVASSGMSYSDAKTTIENITNRYKNNPEYQSEFAQKQPENISVYRPPVTAFDPYKLKGADKEVYFKALEAIQEIETANYALLRQAGLQLTQNPVNLKNNETFKLY